MSSTSSKQIKITHVVNPHLFWFKYVNTPGPELGELERKIEKFVAENRENMQASVHRETYRHEAYFAVYINSMKKWVRAEINPDDLFETPNKPTVWAIDYGIPLRTTLDFIVLLSVELKKMCGSIKSDILKGGMADIKPASSRMDVIFIFIYIFSN